MVGADPFNRLQSALLYPSEFTPSAHGVPVCTQDNIRWWEMMADIFLYLQPYKCLYIKGSC